MDLETLHGYGAKSSEMLEQIVDDYVVSADGNLNVGDLCEFINGHIRKTYYSAGTSSVTQINSVGSSWLSSVVLNSNQVLVVYDNGTNYGYLYGVVLTINVTTISIGTLTQITAVNSSCTSLTILDSTHILLNYINNSTGYGWATILTISGSIIIAGTPTQITTISSTSESSVLLNSTQVLVCFVSGIYLYGVVLTISGSTISLGTVTQMNSYTPGYLSLILLSSNVAIITFGGIYNSANCLMTQLINISGNTISFGTVMNVIAGGTFASATKIDSSHVLVCHSNNAYVYGTLLVISGNTINAPTTNQLTNIAGTYISIILLDSTHVFLGFCGTGSLWGGIITVSVSANTIAVGSFYQLSNINIDNSVSITALNSTTVCASWIGNGTSYYVYSVLLGISGTTISNTIISHIQCVNAICLTSTVSGNTAKCGLKGIMKGLNNLVPNNTYYCDTNGNLTATVTNYKVGVALSTTELLINKGFWER